MFETMTLIEWIIAAVMFMGLFSLVLVVVPGLTIIWVAALVYLFVDGLNWGSGIIFGVITLLMIFGNLVDNYMMGASARQKGASWLAIGVALLGGLLGSILWTPLGGLLIALLGLFAVEYIRLRDWRQAYESTRSMLIGCGWAGIIRFGIGLVMISLYAIWAFILK